MGIDVVANMKAKVGRQLRGDGDDVIPWAGRQADLIVAPFGKYYQAALDGYIYQGTTPDGGVTPLQNSNGTAGELSLYNPNGSGVNLVLMKVDTVYLSGTLVAGPVFLMLNINPSSAATTGTACARTGGKISGGGSSVASLLDGSTIPEVPTYGQALYHVGAWAAGDDELHDLHREVDGAIIIPPGCCASIISQMAGGGSSPLVYHSMLWAEVPV